MTVGRAFERLVVNDPRRSVSREHHVELDGAQAEAPAPPAGRRAYSRAPAHRRSDARKRAARPRQATDARSFAVLLATLARAIRSGRGERQSHVEHQVAAHRVVERFLGRFLVGPDRFNSSSTMTRTGSTCDTRTDGATGLRLQFGVSHLLRREVGLEQFAASRGSYDRRHRQIAAGESVG